MAEKRLLVDRIKINYSGLFNVGDLYFVIDKWLKERGYDKVETDQNEFVKDGKKNLFVILQPYKKLSDYAKIQIDIYISINDLETKTIELDMTKVKMNTGSLNIMFKGWIITDYENRWEESPVQFFIRTIMDKFIYKNYMRGWEQQTSADTLSLREEIKSFLNLYKYRKDK